MSETFGSLSLFWVVFAVVVSIIEIFSPLFGFILVGGAAFITSFVAYLGFDIVIQLFTFALGLFVSFAFLRRGAVGQGV